MWSILRQHLKNNFYRNEKKKGNKEESKEIKIKEDDKD